MGVNKNVRDCIEDILTTYGFDIEIVSYDDNGSVCTLAVMIHPRDMNKLKDELLKDTPSISHYPFRGLVNYRGFDIQESFICNEGEPKLIKIL